MYPFFSPEYHVSSKEITIKHENVFRAMQVPFNQEDEYTKTLISEYTTIALEICDPRAGYAIFEKPEFRNANQMKLEGFEFHLDKMVTASLKKSSHMALFVATAGRKLEELSSKLIKEGHLLEGVIVDILGSEIAEETTRNIHQVIKTEMESRYLNVTNRYSPGYCNWPVSDQHQLFSLLGKNNCGVELTESSLMLPVKSVSGIVGVGAQVKFQEYFCDKCRLGACIYRNSQNFIK